MTSLKAVNPLCMKWKQKVVLQHLQMLDLFINSALALQINATGQSEVFSFNLGVDD